MGDSPDPRGLPEQIVLVTGCSTGIGRAAAIRLARSGHRVYATARRDESVEDLAQLAEARDGHLIPRRLDVTNEDEIAEIVREIRQRHGTVNVLINNAGYGQIGAVEEVSNELWRRQLEVNLLGAVAVTRACLPAMRARGGGRIINVSSVVAHVALPLMGAYCASKHALDAYSVALRREVRAFGIEVSLIEVGPVATRFRESAEELMRGAGIGEGTPYASMHRVLHARWQSRFGRQRISAEDVAACVERAVRAKRLRLRYRIGAVARWTPLMYSFLPERVVDAYLRLRTTP